MKRGYGLAHRLLRKQSGPQSVVHRPRGPVHAGNILERYGIGPNQLADVTDEDLLAIPLFGTTCLRLVRDHPEMIRSSAGNLWPRQELK